MNTPSRPARRAILGFLWLSLFAILYTAGDRLGLWPPLPAGAFRDWDLGIGALGAAALVLVLATDRATCP